MILLNSMSLHTTSFAAVFFFSVYQNDMVKSINGDKWFHQRQKFHQNNYRKKFQNNIFQNSSGELSNKKEHPGKRTIETVDQRIFFSQLLVASLVTMEFAPNQLLDFLQKEIKHFALFSHVTLLNFITPLSQVISCVIKNHHKVKMFLMLIITAIQAGRCKSKSIKNFQCRI